VRGEKWPVFPSHEMEASGQPMRLMPFSLSDTGRSCPLSLTALLRPKAAYNNKWVQWERRNHSRHWRNKKTSSRVRAASLIVCKALVHFVDEPPRPSRLDVAQGKVPPWWLPPLSRKEALIGSSTFWHTAVACCWGALAVCSSLG
jgi:hypothetical protein